MNQIVRESSPASYIPSPSALVTQLRADRIIRFTPKQAEQLRLGWIESRKCSDMQQPTGKTVARYRKMVADKTAAYGRRPPLHDTEPFNCVLHFLADDSRLAPTSRNWYRSAFLHVFEERICALPEGPERGALTRGIAVLIASHKPSQPDRRQASQRPPKAAKSITRDDCTLLLESLRQGRGNAPKAADFAEVTYLTGLRPGEWADTTAYAASSAEATMYGGDDQHFVLLVRTSKRKGETISYRTIRVDVSIWDLVERHLNNFRSAQAKNDRGRKSDAVEDLIKRTSVWLTTTCERLWPGDVSRRVTVRSMRSQARANYLTAFSSHDVAILMGHHVATGDGYYAPRRKASLGPKSALVCSPGIQPKLGPLAKMTVTVTLTGTVPVPMPMPVPVPVPMPMPTKIDLTPVFAPPANVEPCSEDQSQFDDDEMDDSEVDHPRC